LVMLAMWHSAEALESCVTRRSLPAARLHVAYATDRSLGKVVRSVCEHGVNVVVWSFAHFRRDSDSLWIEPTFSLEGVARVKDAIASAGVEAAHLVSFGGWNGPHPDAAASGERWFDVWNEWNGGLFDGVDWDFEGHDDPTAPTTELSPALLDLVVDFTREARREGYLVGIAPPESYLDSQSTENIMSLRLNHQPRAPWGFDFPYAGRNAYAGIVARCDFDFVSLQLYEGYSSACFALTQQGASPVDYLVDAATRLRKGFDVVFPFGSDDERQNEVVTVAVPPERLVFGFANGWADGAKFVRVDPKDIALAFARLGDRAPRGTMFWVLDEEGEHDDPFATDDDDVSAEPYFFAKDLSDAFKAQQRATVAAALSADW